MFCFSKGARGRKSRLGVAWKPEICRSNNVIRYTCKLMYIIWWLIEITETLNTPRTTTQTTRKLAEAGLLFLPFLKNN